MVEAQRPPLVRVYQLEHGYCYNSDSLFLFAFSRAFLKRGIRVLDVGCGCGILGALCARDFACEITMVEKDRQSAFLAKINVPNAKIHCMDFLDFESEEKFDVILSNPPFYRAGALPSKNPRLNLARNEQSLPLEPMLERMKNLLSPNGVLLFCYGARESHRVFYALKKVGFNTEVARFVHPRLDCSATLLMIQAKIQSKQSLTILPPLIAHIGRGQKDHSEVQEIYYLCNTYSIKIEEL